MLETYGWSEALQRDFAPHAAEGLIPGRVIAQHRGQWRLAGDLGETRAELSGRLARDAEQGGYPVTGDWVAASSPLAGGPALIEHVLPRRTAFTRRSPEGLIQVVAANADIAFLVTSLEGDLNLRRLERYLVQAWASGAAPVMLLTKADLALDLETAVDRVGAIASGAPVVALSTVTGAGLDQVRDHLAPGATAVMVGASGAGKSTLANLLLGEERMATGAVRADDGRGRHTTSHRELILLPGGALLLDTPGMRELALNDAEEGVTAAFDDIEALAAACKFSDCSHGNEPGCAVRAALEGGDLEEGRWRSFLKLTRELNHLARREDPALRAENRKHWIAIHKANRARTKFRERE